MNRIKTVSIGIILVGLLAQIDKTHSKTGREPDPQVKDMIPNQIEIIATSRLKLEETST
jgi:hypothetical protein